MLKIHEASSANGALSGVFLRFEHGALAIVEQDGDGDGPGRAWPLPDDAIDAVMAHFGAPFDPDASVSRVGELALAGERTLTHVRHLAGYDVIARDYLVFAGPRREPVCAMAALVAGALLRLARSPASAQDP
jgi:hypothetical protein